MERGPDRVTISALLALGPGYVRDFIQRPHEANEFARAFSWLGLAESVGLQVALTSDKEPALAARWAEVAAILYEGLVRGSRPQDNLARSIWTRTAAHYRAMAAGTTPSPVHPPSDAREPHTL